MNQTSHTKQKLSIIENQLNLIVHRCCDEAKPSPFFSLSWNFTSSFIGFPGNDENPLSSFPHAVKRKSRSDKNPRTVVEAGLQEQNNGVSSAALFPAPRLPPDSAARNSWNGDKPLWVESSRYVLLMPACTRLLHDAALSCHIHSFSINAVTFFLFILSEMLV